MEQQQISWRASILRLTHFFTILSLLLALVGTAPAEALAANIPTGIQQAGQAELNAPVSHAQDGPLASPADVAALSPGVTDTLDCNNNYHANASFNERRGESHPTYPGARHKLSGNRGQGTN